MKLEFRKSGSAVGLALALLGAGVGSSSVSAPASASAVTLTFSGVLTNAAANFNVGDPFSASVVYDTSLSVFTSLPTGTEFAGPVPLLVTVGASSYSFFSVFTYFQLFHGSNAMAFNANGLAFVDITNLPVIPTSSLPPASYLLNATYTFGLDVTSGICCESLIGGPASLSISPAPPPPPALTPLPSSWIMFLFGLVGVGLVSVYRQSNHRSAGIAIA